MKTVLPLIGLVALATPALAQDGPPRGQQPSTRAELETMVKDRFAATDTNKDGFIDKAEAEAARSNAGGPRPDGPPPPGGGRGMLDRADSDGDGKVSLAEALAPALARFDATDTDKSGTISDQERQAARERMRQMWQERQQMQETPQQ